MASATDDILATAEKNGETATISSCAAARGARHQRGPCARALRAVELGHRHQGDVIVANNAEAVLRHRGLPMRPRGDQANRRGSRVASCRCQNLGRQGRADEGKPRVHLGAVIWVPQGGGRSQRLLELQNASLEFVDEGVNRGPRGSRGTAARDTRTRLGP